MSEAGQSGAGFNVRRQTYRVISRIDDGVLAATVAAVEPSLAQWMRTGGVLQLMQLLHLEQMGLA
ncbi:hypothetical protein FDG2_5156 [Candidatus Protofrankia californiensis]|uniref:Uncharacterized protein n=1 Tax=Candidatus Protofrankia californiensis TaxID=1839754 RepID=A0A1C3PBA9_9ACTN|nr:hypothetical protein FDG2_5156 [Candidatus Protofrankia californiensis]